MNALLIVYVATRLITADGLDTTNVTGWADVLVGPQGEISELSFSMVERPCDDGTGVQFSPAPPECFDYGYSAESVDFTPDGRLYEFSNDRAVHILRRGTVETGDPSLIMMLEDGTTVFFREEVQQ